MKRKLILVGLILITGIINSTAYITHIVNNTKQELRFRYNIKTATRFIKDYPWERNLSCAHYAYSDGNGAMFSLVIYPKTAVVLSDAYIPNSNISDYNNVISLGIKATSNWMNFALLRKVNNKCERVNLSEPKFIVETINENLIENSSYTLEINQISPEIFNYVYGRGELVVQDSFKILLTKNDSSSDRRTLINLHNK